VPQQLTYPGVYVEEVDSGVRTIVGVATSITAFIGRTAKGPDNAATLVLSYDEFVATFGGIWAGSKLPFAVRDFFLNGGRQALICRLYVAPAAPPGGGDQPSGKAQLKIGADGDTQVSLIASSPGAWGNALRATVDHQGLPPNDPEPFNLTLTDSGGGQTERYVGLSLYSDRARNIRDVLETQSQLVRWAKDTLLQPPAPGTARVGPADGKDAASLAEDTAKTAAKDAKDKGRAGVAAQPGQAAADAANTAAKTALDNATKDQTAKQDAAKTATAAETTAKGVLDAATAKVAEGRRSYAAGRHTPTSRSSRSR